MSKPIKTSKSKFWQYDFQFRGQRFHGSTKCTAYGDAKRFIADLKRKAEEGELRKARVTVDDGFGLWWAAKGSLQKNWRTTEGQLARLVETLGADTPLAEVGIRDFDQHVARRSAPDATGKTLAPATINREIELARRVWKWLDSREYAVKRIAWGNLLLKEPQERIRELSAEEEKKLFLLLDPRLVPVVQFALMSGKRRSEVIRLEWDRISWNAMTATVAGKGDTVQHIILTQPMIKLLREQPRVDGCPFVFTYECERDAPARDDRPARKKGARYPFTVQGWRRRWKAALTAAGIKDFRFHDLRHTAATRLVRTSGNLKLAQKMLGHTDIATTARYAHATEDDLRGVLERMHESGSPSRNEEEEGSKS